MLKKKKKALLLISQGCFESQTFNIISSCFSQTSYVTLQLDFET